MTLAQLPPAASLLLGGWAPRTCLLWSCVLYFWGFTDPLSHAPRLIASPSHGPKASHSVPLGGLRVGFLAPFFPPPASPPPLLFLLLPGG